MPKPLVVVGSINLDLVAFADHIPRPGETIIGSSFQTFFGGKGANQAVAAAKLGYPVSMVGCVGDDAFGPQLRSALAGSGVDTAYVKTVPGSSGVALITIAAGGENSIVVVPGANAAVSPQMLQSAAVLQHAGFLLAQLEIPLETVEYLAHFAQRHQIPLMLDPAPARGLPATLLSNVDWLTPNESETERLVGSKLGADQEPAIAAADQLLATGAGNVVLKLGARGCLIAERDRPKQFVPAFRVNAVDTTAAGDAFNAAFAVSLLRGADVRASARYACAVAAISVSRHGAQPSMPASDEVDAFLSAHSSS
ncbi:MAG TPA: ribokinase [Terriglobales bacterium]